MEQLVLTPIDTFEIAFGLDYFIGEGVDAMILDSDLQWNVIVDNDSVAAQTQ
jgi:hypothetical protein